MNPLYYLLAIPIVLAGLIYQNYRQRRRVYRFLKQTWGKPAKKTYYDKLPSINQYWQATQHLIDPADQVDAITWNDLEMDLYFQSLNTTYSSIGSETLYARLHNLAAPSVEAMVTVLRQDETLRFDLAYYLYGMGKKDDNEVPDYLFSSNQKKIVGYHPIQSILPLIGLGLMFVNYPAGMTLMGVMIALNSYTRLRSRLVVNHGVDAIRYISKAILFSRKLAQLTKDKLPNYSQQLHAARQPLASIPSRGLPIDSDPTNFVYSLASYLNMVFLLDFQQYNQALKILEKHPGALHQLWETIGQLEAALVIASLDERAAVNQPNLASETGITAQDLVHPLIEQPVANDVNFTKSILVSGSNASGKSTYVKAIAISAITAQTLNRVYAEDWRMKPGQVISSMAIRDNIYQGDSYFVAEIKSLKRMIQASQTGRTIYLFIDEILKGTNTIERIAASNALLDYFHHRNALVIAATHDIELTELQAQAMQNVHFRETISQDEIEFDYQLKAGPTQSTNAINLLRYYDFPDTVTDQANQQAESFKKTRSWH